MLSKIIAKADSGRAQPAVFPQTSLSAPAARVRESPTDDDTRALRAQVHRLESEIVAVKRESFEAGVRQGEQTARAEIAPVIDRMNKSIADLAAVRQELRGRAEKDVVQLALLVARRILHREVNIDPGALTALARVVFERLARSESYRITVHPRFAPAIQSSITGRLASRVEIESDAALDPGAFIVHSSEGTLDASIDTQLEEISRGLTDRLAGI